MAQELEGTVYAGLAGQPQNADSHKGQLQLHLNMALGSAEVESAEDHDGVNLKCSGSLTHFLWLTSWLP